jgi:SAM-dependent methyltransferase
MAKRASNRQRNLWVVSLLSVQPTDRVLEIGFGPGIAIKELSRLATAGHVYGVDHSAVMVSQASKRNARAIRAWHATLQRASVENLPNFGQPLDTILAVNSMGFWPDPRRSLRELRTKLRPGRQIAIASHLAVLAQRATPLNERHRRSNRCSKRPASPCPHRDAPPRSARCVCPRRQRRARPESAAR